MKKKSGEETYIVFDYFEGEKLIDDEEIFKALAPFIEDGGQIYFYGEDDTKWRFTFENGEVIEDFAELAWPEDREKIYRYINENGECKGIIVASSEKEAREKIEIYTDKPYTLKLWESDERKAVGDVILFK